MVGTPYFTNFSDGSGSSAYFNLPMGISVNKRTRDFFVADYFNSRIRKVTSSGQVTTIAGNSIKSSLDGYGTSATFYGPTGLLLDSAGNIYVADTSACVIRKMLRKFTKALFVLSFFLMCFDIIFSPSCLLPWQVQ